MNLRTFATVSAVAMFVLGGCIINTTSGQGGGGNGGSGNTGNEGGAGVGGSMTTSSSSGTGGTGGMAACQTCVEFVSADVPGTLCEMSAKIYNALSTCVCGDAQAGIMGKCATQCEKSVCAGGPTPADPMDPCVLCVNDANAGCGNEFGACSNDF